MTPEQRAQMNETSSNWHKANRKRMKELGFVSKRTWVHADDIDLYDDFVETLKQKPAPLPKKGGALKLPGLD